MKTIINNLGFILPILVLAGILVYTFWWRERPRAEGRITGDFQAAVSAAAAQDATLLLAVDNSPH